MLNVADLKKRLEERREKAARLKAATEKIENVVHKLEERIHEVESNADRVHAKIRETGSKDGSI